MAARKTTYLNDSWRARIKTSMLINRLQSFVNGEVEMQPHQVTAALGLLRKTAPDLSATTLSDPAGNNPFASLMELIASNGRPRPGNNS